MIRGHKQLVSTDMVPERQRAEWWRQQIGETFGNLTVDWMTDGPIYGRIASRRFAVNLVMEVSAAPRRGVRSPGQVARVSLEVAHLTLRRSGRACFRQNGHELVLEAGDLVLGDSTLPYEALLGDNDDYVVWELPRAKLMSLVVAGREPFVTRIPGDHGLGALLTTYLHSLHREMESIPLESEAELQHQLCKLVALAVGPGPELGETGRAAYRAALLRQVVAFVERHLADGELSAERAAGHLGMSVRSLQRLFDATGTSFWSWTQRRRLEECRRLLLAPAHAHRSVADIAYACGFNDLSAFYRAFRAQFAMTPSDLRAAAGRDPVSVVRPAVAGDG